MVRNLSIKTRRRYELIDITHQVEKEIAESGIKNGICLVYLPHSTAAIILTENEEGLKRDWLKVLQKLVKDLDFEHNRIDDNADSHILSGLLGQGKTLLVENGRLIRGTWQQIFLVELDGPRKRKVIVSLQDGASCGDLT